MGAVTSFLRLFGYKQKKYEFFISYASCDSAIVHPLCKVIGATKKNSFFIDAYQLEPGKRWANELAQAIRSCDTVFVFWSKNSANSEWVKAEYEVAIARRKNVIPIILDKTPLPDLLDEYQSIKFSDRNIEEKEVSKIFDRIDRQKTQKRLNEFRTIALACIIVGAFLIFAIQQSEDELDPLLVQLSIPIDNTSGEASNSIYGDNSLQFLDTTARFVASYHPTSNAGIIAKRNIQSQLSRVGPLVTEINQIDSTKPNNWDALTTLVTAVDIATKDTENQSALGGLRDLNAGANSLTTIAKRLDADAKLRKLEDTLNEIARNIRYVGSAMATQQTPNTGFRISGSPNRPIVGFQSSKDTGEILSIIPGGPADDSNLQKGDVIRSINRVPVTLENLDARLGAAFQTGRAIDLGVVRNGQNYSISIQPKPQCQELIEIDYNTNWYGVYTNDFLQLTNVSGRNLSNCVLVIRLHDANQDRSVEHLHTLPFWAAGTTHSISYKRDGEFGYSQTFDLASTVTVELTADQSSGNIRHIYPYIGAAFDADVERYCKKLRMTLRANEFEEGIFWKTNAGVTLGFEGLNRIPPCDVEVSYQTTNDTITGNWTLDRTWDHNESFRHPDFNGLSPIKRSVVLDFPHTSYSPQYNFGATRSRQTTQPAE